MPSGKGVPWINTIGGSSPTVAHATGAPSNENRRSSVSVSVPGSSTPHLQDRDREQKLEPADGYAANP